MNGSIFSRGLSRFKATLVGGCIAMGVLATPLSASAVALSIDAAPDVALGDTVTVDVVIDSAPDAATLFDSFRIELDFDDTVLSLVSLTPGAITAGALIVPTASPAVLTGTFFDAIFNLAPVSLVGEAVIASVTFEAIAAGTTDVGFVNSFLSSFFSPLPNTGGVSSAQVTVAPATTTVPEPGPLALVLIAAIAFVGRRVLR